MSTSDMLRELGEIIAAAHPDAVTSSRVTNGELTLGVTPAGLRGLVGYLSDNAACRFTTLVDVTAVDWPGRERRFDVVYHFLSMQQNQRIRRHDVRQRLGPTRVEQRTERFHPLNRYTFGDRGENLAHRRDRLGQLRCPLADLVSEQQLPAGRRGEAGLSF